MNSGVPSASCITCSSSRVGNCAPRESRDCTIACASASESRRRTTGIASDHAFLNSVRAVSTSRSRSGSSAGKSCAAWISRTRRPSRSSVVGSAQCRSSITTTMGWRRPMPARSETRVAIVRSPNRSRVIAGSGSAGSGATPSSRRSTATLGRAGRPARSTSNSIESPFAVISSTTGRSGESRFSGRQRPSSQSVPSTECCSSRTRRDFPMPTSPDTNTQAGTPERTRCHVLCSSPSSRSRPTAASREDHYLWIGCSAAM
jgi:hypothetical protein